jgi:hypothetical protein
LIVKRKSAPIPGAVLLSLPETNTTRKVAVGTVKKSHEADCARWFVRKVRHVWDDGF